MTILLIILILLLLISFLWLGGVFFVNDFSLPIKDIGIYKHILVIFPHADDEILHASGVIYRAVRSGNKATLVIVTTGERGTPDAHVDERLKAIRTKEAQIVANLYGTTKLMQEDFGDGELTQKRTELTRYIMKMIQHVKPDLIITYDLAGEYGHEDHITVSEIVTAVVKKNFTTLSLWYATFPKRIYTRGNFPTHMAKDPDFMKRRAPATVRVPTGRSIIQKMQAPYLYKSQYQSFRSAIPYNLPLWFVFSVFIDEYFYIAN